MRIRKLLSAVVVLATAASVGAAPAKDRAQSTRIVDGILGCAALTDAGTRLACFDEKVKGLQTARASDENAFIDKKVVKESRPEFREINSTVSSIAMLEQGKWLIVLADNSVWQSYEGTRVIPAQGDKVRISKGALGSYLGNVGQVLGARLKRLR